jgi:hypothetical protein
MFPNDCEVANGKKEDEFWASSLTTVRRTNAAAACRCAAGGSFLTTIPENAHLL